MKTLLFLFLSLLALASRPAAAAVEAPDSWGIMLTARTATIPYANSDTDTVQDLLPALFYYDSRWLFLDGLTAGVKLYDRARWRLSALARYRYTDMPADLQNGYQLGSLDIGAQLRYRLSPALEMDFEILNDKHTRYLANLRASYTYEARDFSLLPKIGLRWKSARFNDYYYGLEQASPGPGMDLDLSLEARLALNRHFYFFGSTRLTVLDDATYQASTIDARTQAEVMLGIGYYSKHRHTPRASLKSRPYLRIMQGWSTPSSLGEISSFSSKADPYQNTMTSLFYGHPLSDTLFGAPISVYLTPGVVYHYKSEKQASFPEYVLAMKGFYKFKTRVRTRIGFGVGFSYLTHITYIEQQEMDINNYKPSHTMAYLDFSFGANMADLFRAPSLKKWWLGYAIHHRSSVYETSAMFGRIKGGSNYHGLYAQYHW